MNEKIRYKWFASSSAEFAKVDADLSLHEGTSDGGRDFRWDETALEAHLEAGGIDTSNFGTGNAGHGVGLMLWMMDQGLK